MRAWTLLGTGLLLAAVAAAPPVLADDRKDESGKGKEARGASRGEPRGEARGHEDWFHRHGHARLEIPPGHYPPPGQCRIWDPDLPPGQQAPPGSCRELRRRVPAGAWLLERSRRHPDDVDVIVYDEGHPGRILEIGVFRVDSGAFLRLRARR